MANCCSHTAWACFLVCTRSSNQQDSLARPHDTLALHPWQVACPYISFKLYIVMHLCKLFPGEGAMHTKRHMS